MSDRKLFGAASARYRAFTDAARPPIKIALNDGRLAAGRTADFAYEFEGAALRVFRLVQAAENRVTPLRPLAILRALLPNVLFFSAEAEANRRLLEILSQAATEIAGYNLAFRNNPTFWEVLP